MKIPTFKSSLLAGAVFAALTSGSAMAQTSYGYETVDDVRIFFREAGNPENPALVLLHGFPSSSHQYRELIDDLSDAFYLIAPDYPGFGASDFPSAERYEYTFDNIADTMDSFLESRGLDEYSLYIQDYGAPIGMRIATEHPERVQALVVQNGNVYEEGLSPEAFTGIRAFWEAGRTPEFEAQLAAQVFSLEALKWQYTHGTRNPEGILPDNWLLDHQLISREGQHDMQIGLFFDYQNNVAKYPEWQAYLKEHQPPALIVWGANDFYFPAPGAEGFRRDLTDVDYNILDTGHFALEEDGALIAEKIRGFFAARNID